MFCSQCGATLQDEGRFCARCGTAVGGPVPPTGVGAPSPQAEGPPLSHCGACGAANRPGVAFCERCGASLLGVTAPAIRATPLGLGSVEADHLGGPLAEGAPRPKELDPSAAAVVELRRSALAAGAAALVFLGVCVLYAHTLLVLILVGPAGLYVAWKCFVTVPNAIRGLRYREARAALIPPAIVSFLLVGIVPGIILIAAHVRAQRVVDTPPVRLYRGP